MGRFDGLYRRVPLWGQHAAVSLYGFYWHWLRFGPGSDRFRKDYLERERFNDQQWSDWQRDALGKVLAAAALHVPYYSSTWTDSEKAAARAGRVQDLPLLGKDAIRSDPEAFLRSDVRPWLRPAFHTSGSTGTPVRTIWTVGEIRDSMAVREVRSAGWAGVSFQQPRATFSGRLIEPEPESDGPFYRFNAIERQVYLSAFHLRPQTAPLYVRALARHRIEWLTGYAVSYYLLARFMLDQGLRTPGLKAVVTTSEKVTPAMRKTMEAAYGCPVYEEYSNVENSLFASECREHRLHVSPDVGLVEILRPDGTPSEPGETGELVSTTLLRWYQPLIRYRLGDVGRWDSEPCPCGRPLPVLKEVVGRVEDVVVGPDGRQLVRFHGVFIDQPHVREGQIIQEALDRIRVRIVPDGAFGPVDREETIQRVRQRLGPRVEIVVETVEEIPRSAAGKFRAVVSLIGRPANQPDSGAPGGQP
ncbi:MAG TPA: hypothetical protein VEO37_11580 [Thermoanaerobaculia bacterium]|nr:hypothetical protein [Thermoanaerobaculia bacterium]